MATHRWIGTTAAVAQTATVQVTGYDAATTYKLTVGGQVVSTPGTGGTVNTTATALAAAWNASTHPYFTGVTASAATDTVTLTTDSGFAGVPFTATSSVTGGTGTIGSVTAGTANAGPNVLAAANFDSGTLPGNGDTVIFENNSTDVLWVLDALTSVTTLTVLVYPTFTGKIGLNKRQFQSTASSAVTTAVEYREDEFTIDGATLFHMPAHNGQTTPSGSGRVVVNTKASAAVFRIENTATSATDSGLEPVRIRGTSITSATVSGNSVVGICTQDFAADAATVTTLYVAGSAKVNARSGTTLTTLTARDSATVRLESAPTTINAGDSSTSATITTAAASGTVTTATIGPNASLVHVGGASTISTLNLAGELDLTAADGAVTLTTCNIDANTARVIDPANKLANNTDFVFRANVSPGTVLGQLAGGRTLRKTA